MKEKRLLKVFGEIEEKYVEEAAPVKKRNDKTPPVRWGMMAACLCIACAATILLLTNDRDEAIPGDLAPMVFVNDTLYRQSRDQTGFAELKDEFEYPGEITDAVDSSRIPEKEFQANDPITGAAVYQYDDNIVVRINGKYWLYEAYGKESVLVGKSGSSEVQSESIADYPLMIMIDGQLYCDSGEIITEEDLREPDGEIASSCNGEPTENNQSNFGTGYGYKYGNDGVILVQLDDGWRVFTPYTARKDIDWDSLSEQEKMEIDPNYNAD